jgi:adenine-specific DNA-methyltransferase
MSPEEQEAVIRITEATYRPNLAIAFAHLALAVLRDRGVLAMITPNSLFEASSGRSVRAALAEVLTPQLIARLGEQTVFARALVDAGIYVGKRIADNSAAITTVLWADSRPNSLNRALRGLRKWRTVDGEPLADEGFSVYRRDDIGKSAGPWVARDYKSWVTYRSIRNTKRVVSAKKLFDIRLGVRLGNDAFVLPKEYVLKLPINEQQFFRPAVMNLSISDAVLNDNYYVFYRYSTGLPEISSEDELERYVPTYFAEVLLPAKSKLAARKTLARAGMNWWELLEHRAWLRERHPKIVSKYFGKRRSFAFDKTGDYVVVVGNAWLLNKGTIELDVTDEEISYALLTYLSSSTTEDLLKYVSIQVSGGQWDLSNKYLETLPVPDFSKLAKTDHDIFNELVQVGIRISEGRLDRWADVDELVTCILNG